MHHPPRTGASSLPAVIRLVTVVLVILCLADWHSFAGGQTLGKTVPDQPPVLLPAAQLQEDFALFKRAYEELHPGLYRYNTRAQMEAYFRELEKQFQRDCPLPLVYLAYSRFLSKIKCGHTYPNFYNQPALVEQALFRNQDRVPFYFRWIDRRMIVTRNFASDTRLAPGTEVLAINGIPCRTILQKLLSAARADGSNEAKRISSLEVQGWEQYEAFDIYFPLFFPLKTTTLALQTRDIQGRTENLRVEALTYVQRAAPYKDRLDALRSDKPVWELRFLNEQTACLKMPTWAVYNSKWDWMSFLDQAFEQIAQKPVRNLVIDLRGNEGGSDVGAELLRRLLKRELHPVETYGRWVRYRKVPDDLKPYLSTWDPSFKDWGSSAGEFQDGFARLTRPDDTTESVLSAADHPFAGELYVLVDASNSSATFEFARTVKQNHLGTLIGQPTGGNLRGINGGAFFFLTLPHSRIETDIPLIGYYPAELRPSLTSPVQNPQPDSGIVPDIIVRPRVEDIQKGIDTELTALLEHLNSSPKTIP